jgi:hypothetical protein
MSATLTKRKSDLIDKLKRALRSSELGVKHYKRADALGKEIALELESGQSLKIGGEKVTFIDEYVEAIRSGKDIMWRPCGFRRYAFKRKPA